MSTAEAADKHCLIILPQPNGTSDAQRSELIGNGRARGRPGDRMDQQIGSGLHGGRRCGTPSILETAAWVLLGDQLPVGGRCLQQSHNSFPAWQ